MTFWIWVAILAAAVATLVIWFWKWAVGPSPIRLTSPSVVRDVIQLVITNGAKGARIRLQAQNDPELRIDFVKYIRSHGDVGLRAVIDRKQRLDPARTKVMEIVTRRGKPAGVLGSSREGLEIDIGVDTSFGEVLARAAFEEGLGISLSQDVVGYYDLVLIRNVPRLTGLD